jgi:hypothetical protein
MDSPGDYRGLSWGGVFRPRQSLPMLELLIPPDHDVAAILQAALEHAHLSIPSPGFWSRTTFLKRLFTRHIARRAIQDLLVASKRPESYELTNAHWLLLHDILDLYCEDHNTSPEVDPEADPWPAGDPESRPIPFDSIRSEYFGHPSVPRAGSHVSARDLRLVPSDVAERQRPHRPSNPFLSEVPTEPPEADSSGQHSTPESPLSSRRRRNSEVRLIA